MEEEKSKQPEVAAVDIRQEIQAWFKEHFQNQVGMQTEFYNQLHAAKENLLARLNV